MATINYPSPWLLGLGQGIPGAINQGLSNYYRGRNLERQTAEDALRNELLRMQITEARNKATALKKRAGGLPGRQGAETLSRKDPRYKAARDRGLTDEQIQQRFGIKLVEDGTPLDRVKEKFGLD